MSDFEAFADDIAIGMEYLEHHQILGAKWGVMNGPPYPLGSGDHSSSEKKAAEAAGVKVGSDSGKGSIENVKKKKSGAQNQVKKPKKEMTEEEKREAALKAVRSGDKKKIAKYAEYLTSQELQDADNRVRNLNNIQREEPGVKKASKAEMEKQEAIRSGDKEKVRQYADQMTYQELSEAMNKIDLTQRLNYEPPPKSTMDKISEIANKVDQARQAAEKGIAAYNVAAALYNSTHKGGAQWPIIEKKVNDQKSKEQDVAEKLVKQMSNDMKQNVQQAQQQKQEKTYKEQSKEELRNKKIDYKNQKKYEDWVAKQEKKNKDNDTEEPKQQESQQSNQSNQNSQSNQTNNSPQTEKEARTEQHESNKNFGIHRFNSKTHERVSQAAKEVSGNEFQVDVAFTDKNYSKGPQVKSVNWDTKVNAENISNWRGTWNSVEQASANSRPISDDLTPAEEAFLNSFKR